MTANEMRLNFLIKYDKITNFAAPGYEDSEISILLNTAQERFIKTVYNPKGNKYRDGFEETEKRRKDLSELVRGPRDNSGNLVTSASSNQNGIVEFGKLFDLPEDCWYVIYEEAITNRTNCKTQQPLRVPIRPITHDEYVLNKKNPNRKPYVSGTDGLAWRLDFSKENTTSVNKRHEIITDGTFNINDYLIRYVKKPQTIVVDYLNPANQVNCELDSGVHDEIVDIAVRIATGITDPQQYQIKLNEEITKE